MYHKNFIHSGHWQLVGRYKENGKFWLSPDKNPNTFSFQDKISIKLSKNIPQISIDT